MESIHRPEDSRRSERRIVTQPLRVTDPASQGFIGNLVNLSKQGLMLTLKSPVEANQLIRMALELPREVLGRRSILLEARCVWCQKSSYSEDFGAGFEIRVVSADDRLRLESFYGHL